MIQFVNCYECLLWAGSWPSVSRIASTTTPKKNYVGSCILFLDSTRLTQKSIQFKTDYHIELKFIYILTSRVIDISSSCIEIRCKSYQSWTWSGMNLIFDERSIDVLKECTIFWETRSLYISESAREALNKAMIALNSYTHEQTQNRKIITNALRVIEKCVHCQSFLAKLSGKLKIQWTSACPAR